MKTYPRLVRNGSGSEKRKTCRLCGAHTRSVVCMEYSCMRGDDEVRKVCNNCQRTFVDFVLIELFS